MKIIEDPSQHRWESRKVCVAIGVFDGVHLGHQQVLRQTLDDARQHRGLGVAITFDRHPSSVVAPGRAPALIYSLPKKLGVIESLGLDAAWIIRFDEAFSRKTGETFIRELVRDFGGVQSVRVGHGFAFGHGRTGTLDLLRKLGAELRFVVHEVASVQLDGFPVSSTRAREALRRGDLDAVSQMLGRPYSLSGAVRSGDGLGARIGFATANIDVNGLATPPSGVYAAQARSRGDIYPCAVNIGFRPTLRSTAPEFRVEAHLLDFSGDLRGEELEISFVERLRDEKQFPTLDLLKEQIAADVALVRTLLGH